MSKVYQLILKEDHVLTLVKGNTEAEAEAEAEDILSKLFTKDRIPKEYEIRELREK
jgi:hypothetical protein|tara:strand:+ start:242 stop:409 length:168 start_codon:yes stop_codon:yes gene_type:complete